MRGSRVGLGGLKEANAVIVGVVDQAGELLLPQRVLHVSVVAAGAEGEARDLQAGIAQRDHVGGGAALGVERKIANAGQGACRDAGLDEVSP